jgi:hypothetical protein
MCTFEQVPAYSSGVRGGRKVVGSILDGVTGVFH